MTDSFLNEPAITLAEATRLPQLARNGRRPNPSTIFRWASCGVRGVKLEIRQVGGSKCTSREAVTRFIARLSGDEGAPVARINPPAGTGGGAVELELQAAGF
ncbi:MAG TPA: DUF1580 domain-containing protein [Tepidisphaeraceae bacterium]|jgi:hypothetical protein|nr:DUF1580 domain-containing protein [Tepidisphaeraceae bacterium]